MASTSDKSGAAIQVTLRVPSIHLYEAEPIYYPPCLTSGVPSMNILSHFRTEKSGSRRIYAIFYFKV